MIPRALILAAAFLASLVLSPELSAAYAYRVTAGTSRAWSADAIGFNGQTQTFPWKNTPFANIELVNVLSRSMVNIFRYPGGTVANYWDWQNGIEYGDTGGDFKLANLKIAYDAVGFTPHYVVNMLTPTASTSTERLNSALAMLTSAQSLGLPVTHIELGNEFYLNNTDYVAAFPSGTEYGAMCQTWIAAIKAQFPAAKCALAVTMETRSRLNTWSSQALAACNNYDALVVHWYPQSALDPAVVTGNGTADEQNTQWTAFNAAGGVNLMLSQPNKDWRTLVGGNNLPTDKEIWVTEFNLKDSNGAVRQTWAHGLFVANQLHALLSDSRVRRLAVHNWVGGDKTANYSFNNELSYVLTPHTQGDLTTTPFQFAAPGFATRLFAEAADGCTSIAPLNIEFSPEVTDTGLTSFAAIYGWKFTTPGGANRAVFVNSSSTDYDIDISTSFSTASFLRQVSGNPRTYVTGENSTLLRRTSVDAPLLLRLPAYSITTLGAIADVAVSGTSPNAPVFSGASLAKPGATAYSFYEQSIAGDASDTDGDTLKFKKISGPAWLTVWSNGTISGTPANSDAGANQFVVAVEDPAGRSAQATVQITVSTGTSPTPPAIPDKIVPTSEDTFVYSNSAQNTVVQPLGAALNMRSTASATFSRVAYLKFAPSSLPGTVTSATMSVFYNGAAANNVVVLSSTPTWSASTLTWNNRPDAPGHGTTVSTVSFAPGWNSVNLSSVITGAGTYSISLNEQSNTLQSVSSSRGANPPYLTLTFAAPAITPVAPSISTQPASTSVLVGADVTFTVVASGTPSPSYQWAKNGANIPGATGNALVLTNVQAGDAGSYTVLVTNSAGSVTSSVAVLTVSTTATAPAITTQPQSRSVLVGDTASFTVAATGSPSPTFQWAKNGTNIPGATTSTLTLTNIQTTDAGSYTVTATNSAGSVTSAAATLTVTVPTVAPAITAQPQNRFVSLGSTANFSVTATGSPAPTYQWAKDGVAIPGATSSSFTVTNVQTANTGSYTVTVSNSAGSVTSSAATLALVVGPAITAHPVSQTVLSGTSVTLSVTATGSPAPTYQWSKNGVSITGATASTLTFSSIQTTDAGSYTVIVRNSVGAVTSDTATLTVNVLPSITLHPQSQTTAPGGSATFNVAANGTTPLSFQWTKNGTNLAGATDSTLTLTNVTAADAGNFAVVITNAGGSVTSNTASLTVSSQSGSGSSGTTSGGGSGGGGGSPSLWGLAALATLLAARRRINR